MYEERPPLWRLVGMLCLLGLPLVVGLGLALWEGPRPPDDDLLEDGDFLEDGSFSEAGGRRSDQTRADLPPPARAAVVSITSVPTGAAVLVDLDSVGRTPLHVYELSPGPHVISIRRAGNMPVDTVLFLEGGRPTHLSFLLVDSSSTPELRPEPTGGDLPRMAVLAPDEAEGPQRAAREAAPPEPASPQNEAAVRQPPSASQAGGEREAPGRLHITSEPSGAVVWIGIRAVGVTPLTIPDMPPGDHRITMLHQQGRERYVTNVRVDPGAAAEVHGQLRPRTGTLAVLVRPWGSIYIDGQLHKQDAAVQYEAQLSPGRHRVRVVHPALGVQEREVQISEGASVRLVINLR